ncbi:steroid 17alpha-monooxygenase or 17alpha-hydroxyprogesterone aldolase [Spatholobus suberectus]|nr:steroid 17alpha-monooxygenase or 17alpha-hydroxyprogesterone aldolase [Spatholobus suberectus]
MSWRRPARNLAGGGRDGLTNLSLGGYPVGKTPMVHADPIEPGRIGKTGHGTHRPPPIAAVCHWGREIFSPLRGRDVFGAGGETSATTINWAMAEMIRDPRVMKKAQVEVREVFKLKGRIDEICINELKYLKSVVKETLRLHPAAPLLLPRECGQACEINGYHIPVKSKVIVNAWAIGRDPNYWTEAERFHPERFIDSSIDYKGSNFEYIPFGAGRRICPGSTFGLVNVELVLAFLLYHFDWKLPNGMKSKDLDMTEEFGVTVGRKDDLYLIPVTSRPFWGIDAERREISSAGKES